jgi:dihydroorotate dehydrogenase (fumarate)
MADLRTEYMGIQLDNPVMAGASTLTSHIETIRQLEAAGAAAVVISSLFEEQIQLERMRLAEDQTEYDDLHSEMITVFPQLEHAGPDEHLMWVTKAKEAVGIPVLASLNAVNSDTWIEYASLLEQTGIDGLELNFYSTPTEKTPSGTQIEKEQAEIVRAIRSDVKLPIGVKLSPFYANPIGVTHALDAAGADGFVLFNRFFQPDIDLELEQNKLSMFLSHEGDYGLALRFVALLSGQLQADISASTAVYTAEDVVRLLLAGADCVQVVSALYKHGASRIAEMLNGIRNWMDQHNHRTVAEFQGKLSRENSSTPWAYGRAQYVQLLLKPDPIARHYRIR